MLIFLKGAGGGICTHNPQARAPVLKTGTYVVPPRPYKKRPRRWVWPFSFAQRLRSLRVLVQHPPSRFPRRWRRRFPYNPHRMSD